MRKIALKLTEPTRGGAVQHACPGRMFAGVDVTGFETRHAAPYYTWRAQIRHAYTKMSAGSDMESQLVCAVAIQHHPVSNDIVHFAELSEQMAAVTPMRVMVPGKGYNAEWVHRTIRKECHVHGSCKR